MATPPLKLAAAQVPAQSTEFLTILEPNPACGGYVITPHLQGYISSLLQFGCVTSLAPISGTGGLTWELLCSNKPVLLLFQYGLVWLTMLAEEPTNEIQKTYCVPLCIALLVTLKIPC